MALFKEKKLRNGITTKYHRIVSIHNIINECSIIEIASYLDEENRKKEKNNKEEIIFYDIKHIQVDYNKNLNVDNAYDYLKTTEMFEDAKDV